MKESYDDLMRRYSSDICYIFIRALIRKLEEVLYSGVHTPVPVLSTITFRPEHDDYMFSVRFPNSTKAMYFSVSCSVIDFDGWKFESDRRTTSPRIGDRIGLYIHQSLPDVSTETRGWGKLISEETMQLSCATTVMEFVESGLIPKFVDSLVSDDLNYFYKAWLLTENLSSEDITQAEFIAGNTVDTDNSTNGGI